VRDSFENLKSKIYADEKADFSEKGMAL